jgi:hypothetical protein
MKLGMRIWVRFFVDKRIILRVKSVQCVSNRTSCIVLRCVWCVIIVLNVHVPTENEIMMGRIASVGN